MYHQLCLIKCEVIPSIHCKAKLKTSLDPEYSTKIDTNPTFWFLGYLIDEFVDILNSVRYYINIHEIHWVHDTIYC